MEGVRGSEPRLILHYETNLDRTDLETVIADLHGRSI